MPGTALTIEPGICTFPATSACGWRSTSTWNETGIEVTTLPLQHEILALMK